MIGKRSMVNVAVFLGLAVLLVYFGATQLILQRGGGRTLALDFLDGAGIAPRDDVTMRGVPVGAVTHVALTPQGLVRVDVLLQPGVTVPGGSKAAITRRSPIGDLTVELTPADGRALPTGGLIPLRDTSVPPDPEKTIEALARVLHAVPSGDLGTLVSELATAIRGRGEDLATLSEASADLPERLLQVQVQLRSLIENGPKVTGVLADNAQALADDIKQTAALADILRDRRYDLVDLMQNSTPFANVAGGLIADQKANLACLLADFGTVNATIAEPQHLADLITTLELNHFFFDGVYELVQPGPQNLSWFRVQLLPPEQPPGDAYNPQRPAPGVYPGNACRSIYGSGVGPADQPGPAWIAPGSKVHPGR